MTQEGAINTAKIPGSRQVSQLRPQASLGEADVRCLDVGAIIVTYNSADSLARCLESLEANNITDITVVDNASTDASINVAHALHVRVLPQSENHGFAAACNIGARSLQHDWLLFLNPDAYLAPDALSVVARTVTNQPRIGIVGLNLLNETEQPEPFSYGSDVTLVSMLQRRLVGSNTSPEWVSAGAALVRREAWTTVGGFDEQFFMYWEDVDLCRRLRQAGWAVVRCEEARVTHQRGASLADRSLKTKLYDESADKYFRKHYATPIWLVQRYLRRLYRSISPQVS